MGATKTAVLAVKIISDAKGSARGFSEAERGVGRFTAGVQRASGTATVALGAIGALAKGAFDSASALQQAGGAVESVFGKQAAAVKRYAANAAQDVGLANSAYSDLSAVLGSQLKNMGTSAEQLAPKTNDLIKLGADLAATYGGTTKDAVAALSSLLRGERDPIERYGVSIKQADIEAQLAAQGMDKLTGAQAKAAETTALMTLLTQQTAAAHGAFAREGDTAAGAQARASAAYENAKAKLGDVLLPVVAAGSAAFAGFAGWAEKNSGAVQVLAGVLGTLAAAVLVINGAMRAYRAIAVVATAVQWAWNAALYANPAVLITLAIVAAIAALVAAFVIAYRKVEWFRDLIKDTWKWVQKAWGKVGGFITGGGSDGNGWSAPSPGGGGATPALAGMYGAAAGAGALRAAGGMYAAGPTGAAGSTGAGDRGGDVIYINVSGAIDPDATADRIAGVLARRDKQLGRVGGLTAGLAR